jgi:hypothetical protein
VKETIESSSVWNHIFNQGNWDFNAKIISVLGWVKYLSTGRYESLTSIGRAGLVDSVIVIPGTDKIREQTSSGLY